MATQPALRLFDLPDAVETAAPASDEPRLSYASVRGLALRMRTIAETRPINAYALTEFLEHAQTLASVIASEQLEVRVHVEVADGAPRGAYADAPVEIVLKDADTLDPDSGALARDAHGMLVRVHRLRAGTGASLRRDAYAYRLQHADTSEQPAAPA